MVLKLYVSQHFLNILTVNGNLYILFVKFVKFCLQNYLVTFPRGVFISSKVSNMLIDNKMFFGSFWQ